MPVESGGATRSVRRVALLIDCENESAAHADRILQVAASIGRVAQMNAYADWTNPRSKSWAEACKRHGIRQILVNRTPRGKNTVDNYMSAEAAGLAQSGDIDAVCLVTSDSDFSGAATVVRTAGKDVYGIGSAEGAFAASCTDFFRLGKEGGSWVRGQSARTAPMPAPLKPPARSEPPVPREAETAGGPAPTPAAAPSPTPVRAVPEKPGGVESRRRESPPAPAPRPAPSRQVAGPNLCVCGCGGEIGGNGFLQSGHGGRLVGIIGRGDPVEVARVDWGRVPLSFRKGRYEAEIRRYREQAGRVAGRGGPEPHSPEDSAVPAAVGTAAGTRRCIGIDLAWGERNPTGCVELVWDGGELVLARLDLRRSIQDIVEWIEPDRGDWIVAIDAPLVIRNQTGRRAAEADADRYYRRYQAGAYPSSLDKFGEDHRGGRLWRALEERGGGLLEQPNMLGHPRLVFETYPHIVMVELFRLDRTIKYKARPGRDVVAGQRQLVDAIREHFCGGAASPRLRSNDALEELLREPHTPISDRALKDREELLDGLVGAYMAAWVDAGRPLQGLGNVGEGVMVVPGVRGIGARAAAAGSPGTAAASRPRQQRAPSSQSRAPASPVVPAEARTPAAPRAEGGVLAALRKEPDGSAAAVKPQEQQRPDAGGEGGRGDRAGTRRLIGVALAPGEKGASGCAELGWEDGELVLKRVELVRTVDEIVRWIRPDRGDWIVAAGAPLVVRNETGRREADKRSRRLYGRYGADAPGVNLKRLGRDHRGGRLLDALKRHRGRLLEKAAPAGAGRAVLETSAQPAMIELFGLDRAIRYRQGSAQVRRTGQRELANAIREHLCRGKAGPRLREDGALGELLHESERLLPDDALRDRGDRLEALICAYAAAWVDAQQEIQALGTAGEGVTILPNARGIAPA